MHHRLWCALAIAAVWLSVMASVLCHRAAAHADQPLLDFKSAAFGAALLVGLVAAAAVAARFGAGRSNSELLLHMQHDLSLALAASQKFEEALEHVFTAVFRIEGVCGAGMYWVDADRKEIQLVAHRGLSEPFVRQVVRYGPESPEVALVLQGRSAFGTFGVEFSFDTMQVDNLKALAVLPIRYNDRIIAVLNVASRRLVRFSDETCRVLEDIALRLGAILHRIQVERDLQEAQERALRSERLAALGETVAGFAHESGNALQRAQACLEMLALEVQDRPAAADLVQRLQAAQDDLQHLYVQLRHFTGPILLQRFALSPCAVARAAWDDLEPMRRGRDAGLETAVESEGVSCPADSMMLRRVFRNLLSNALDAASDPVRITVASRAVERDGRPWVEIRVRDNGPGLADEPRARLFEPFFSTKPHGMGLGMAISRRIIEAHEGTIAAAETGEYDGGTEIVIVLPRD